MEKLQSESQRVNDMIELEKKVREESQNTLIRLIEETERKLARDILAEQDERSENEAQFMDLLEKTCKKIEFNIPPCEYH